MPFWGYASTMNEQDTVQVLDATIKGRGYSVDNLDFQRVRLARQADGTRQDEAQKSQKDELPCLPWDHSPEAEPMNAKGR